MENSKFFLTVSRINSILILLVAIGAVISIIVVNVASNNWGNRNTVQVHDERSKETIDLRLGNLEEMKGHDIQTVNLLSDIPSHGFSSGYGDSEIRNVLFLSGEELKANWLYESNNFLINCFCKLQKSNKYNGDDPVLAIYVSVVKNDSNHDGELSSKDDITLALAKPDGSSYIEVDSGISKILDSAVSENGDSVTFLLHIGSSIMAKKYSLSTFGFMSERAISEISKKL